MMTANHVMIAANSRLTRTLMQQRVTDGVIAESRTRETPEILTWEQWWRDWEARQVIQGRLSAQTLPQRVLSPFEATQQWAHLLHRHLSDQPAFALFDGPDTARELYQAWSLWHECVLGFEGESSPVVATENDLAAFLAEHSHSGEARLWHALADHYRQFLHQHRFLDGPTYQRWRYHQLKTQVEAGAAGLPETLTLAGFDEWPPAMRSVIALMRNAGVTVNEDASAEVARPQVQTAVLPDARSEWHQAAHWAAQTLAELSESRPLAQIRIGLVAPDWQGLQPHLKRALDEALHQTFGQPLSGLSDTAASTPSLVNFSQGDALSQLPIVDNALQTLDLALQPEKPLSYQVWSDWLCSPYTAGLRTQRQALDKRLRRWQWSQVVWPSLLKHLKTEASGHARLPTRLARGFETVLAREAVSRVSVGEFVERARQLLADLAWADPAGSSSKAASDVSFAGEKTSLSSREQQQKQAFLEALDAFAGLSLSPCEQRPHQWLTLLRRFLSERVHQPESLAEAPIQVMGMLEAGGQAFDALWVLQLTDQNWPRPPKPNAFLPVALQRAHACPRSSVEREFDYAQGVTERLRQSAPQSVWSYPRLDGEATVLPSPLIEAVLLADRDQASPSATSYAVEGARPDLIARQAVADPVIWVRDDRAPPVEAGEELPGGVGILTAQSQCPLMAFMDFRLGARYGLEEVEDGVPRHHLGTLVHWVLEHFWRAQRTQAQLLALSDSERETRVADLVQEGLAELADRYPATLLKLEQRRLTRLVLDWLALEAARSPFEVVAFEQAYPIELAGMRLQIKVDRVDALAGTAPEQRHLLLDYKTGKASAKDLWQWPIKAPQLAAYLYAVDDVGALGYGILHSDDGVRVSALLADGEAIELTGRQIDVSAEAKKDGRTDFDQAWYEALQTLKQQVWQLAEGIQQGDAAMCLMPGRSEKDLAYAAAQLAMRLPEARYQWEEANHTEPMTDPITDPATDTQETQA
ncbi:PD-(D/E)XK nuclease family protein [Hydrogenovibrio halophilus]|uniref:PD-(D/E)XK nuclease family protein n=1 Tax=Hydrogenovibrio halophilus TaxID=373391 RepID=UPI0003745663|nr:PD-(D/E)XK nuclease family protein [Hydrogenovibrio halophilus]